MARGPLVFFVVTQLFLGFLARILKLSQVIALWMRTEGTHSKFWCDPWGQGQGQGCVAPIGQNPFCTNIQLTLVISTPLISILSLMSNWFLSPDYFPYVFLVFQLRVCRTTFMSTLRLSRTSFSVPEYIFHSFYYRVSRTRTMTKKKKCKMRRRRSLS